MVAGTQFLIDVLKFTESCCNVSYVEFTCAELAPDDKIKDNFAAQPWWLKRLGVKCKDMLGSIIS